MENWFTIDKIDHETYVISENKHWEETHCYLLIGTQKCLLIDTGLGIENMEHAVKNLTSLPVEVVTTHVHWDHIGGHRYFQHISVHEAEQEWLSTNFPLPLQVIKSNLLKEPCDFPSDFDIEHYDIYQGNPTLLLRDKDFIDLGNRCVQVIHTPGHSPGHICLYEQEKGYLYSGDLVYAGTLDAYYPTTTPYEFMQSVKRVKELTVSKILPGHHTLDIDVGLINDIDMAFSELYHTGKLIQGKGIFAFHNFKIHI